jgi:DNA-binding beta-propeller fold protein YncE
MPTRTLFTIAAVMLALPAAAQARFHPAGHLGAGIGGFRPTNVAVDAQRHVVAASPLAGKAVFFSPAGKAVAKPSIKSGEFAGVAMSADGKVAIAGQVGDSIPVYSLAGAHTGDYPEPPGNRLGLRVENLAYDAAGDLYGTNVGSDQGAVFGVWAPDLSFTRGILVPDQQNSAYDIHAGPNGVLYYLTDTSNGSTVIARIRPDGSTLPAIHVNIRKADGLSAFAIDRKGNLYMLTMGYGTDFNASDVWSLSPSGRVKRHVIHQHNPGKFKNGGPPKGLIRDVAVDPAGTHLYVANQLKKRIDVYKL